MEDFLKLIIMTAVPILGSLVIDILQKKTSFGKADERLQQIVIGIVFGCIAICSTEFGVNVGGATTNVRDAAPICAGLLFGAPAGIIAGLIGGVERWFAVLWGAGTYTRLACTLSTILAGIIAALVRKYIQKNNRPHFFYAYMVGTVIEIMHMTSIFLTNMNDVTTAFTFVKLCSIPMVLLNGVAVLLAAFILQLRDKRFIVSEKNNKKNISKIFQRGLLICVIVAFSIITTFIWMVQTRVSEDRAENVLEINVNDVNADILQASDENLLAITKNIGKLLNENPNYDRAYLLALCQQFNVSEINMIRTDGIIIESSNELFKGYDMWSGEQSSDFLSKLKGNNECVQPYQRISYDENSYRKYAGIILENRYFLQVGYNAEYFHKDIESQVNGITKHRHIGEMGYIIICNGERLIVSDPNNNEGKSIDDIGITLTNEQLAASQNYKSSIQGQEVYIRCSQTEGYSILGVYYMEEIILERDMSVYVIIFMLIILFAVLFVGLFGLVNSKIVSEVNRINADLSEITEGNLDVVVDVRGSAEFEQLSDDINKTVERLKGFIAEAEEKIDKELKYAKAIQEAALPNVFPYYVGGKAFDLYTSMNTAKEVGGDFYDFYMIGRNKFVFLIADVSGKGIPAAMFMMTAKTTIKGLALHGLSPAEIFTQANDMFCENNEADMFVTAWMGILDINTGLVSYVNAGHNPPCLKSKGKYEFFRTKPGLVLGGMDGIKYKQGELQLEPGDIMYLYTDGVTEATNSENELYGEERLLNRLNEMTDESVEEIGKLIKADVDEFVGDAPQFDDITMLVMKYKAE